MKNLFKFTAVFLFVVLTIQNAKAQSFVPVPTDRERAVNELNNQILQKPKIYANCTTVDEKLFSHTELAEFCKASFEADDWIKKNVQLEGPFISEKPRYPSIPSVEEAGNYVFLHVKLLSTDNSDNGIYSRYPRMFFDKSIKNTFVLQFVANSESPYIFSPTLEYFEIIQRPNDLSDAAFKSLLLSKVGEALNSHFLIPYKKANGWKIN